MGSTTPETDMVEISEEELEELVSNDRFKMLFSPHLIEVKLKPEKVVKPLLREVRRLTELHEAPKGAEGCQDCRKVEKLMGLVGGKSFPKT